MSNDLKEPGLDELLQDVKQLLEQDTPLTTGDARFYEELLTEEEQTAAPKHHSWAETQRLPRHVAKLQRNQEQAYAEWLYEQGSGNEYTPPPMVEEIPKEAPKKPKPKKKKKSRHVLRNIVLTLLLLAMLALAAVIFVLPSQPTALSGMGERRDGVSTILLAGTDADGTRTDTLILLTLDREKDRATLVSIPRDTLVNGSYTVPKINSVYGANRGGQEGIDMLLERVSQCIGFRPDGYVLLDLQLVADFIDELGGIQFHVPMDMYYTDPAQDLVIDLKQGNQVLNGQQSLQLIRYRAGYADQDLGRVQVQRDFLSALMDQTVSAEGLLKAPMLLDILQQADTNLSTRNLLWLARTAMQLDLSHTETATLPGNAVWLNGVSYYVLEPTLVAQTVNTYCNPYQREITPADLLIRTE